MKVGNLVQSLFTFTERTMGADLLVFDLNKTICAVTSCFLIV